MLPRVGPFSTMKLSRPVRMVETDHAGFHVSGWKSVMDKHSLQRRYRRRCDTQVLGHNQKCHSVHDKALLLPRVTFKSPIWCYHIDTGWFKGKFPRKDKFSMIISS